MNIEGAVEFILDKALAGEEISCEEALKLMKIDENSQEIYALMSVANTLARQQFGDRGEVYAQIGINLWPCPSRSCAFCSFGKKWNVFESPMELSLEEVVLRAKAFEDAEANAIFLITTKGVEIIRKITGGIL